MKQKYKEPLMPSIVYGLTLTLVITLLLSAPFAIADEPPHYDRVQLSAQAQAAVENDTLVAILAAQRQGGNVAKLANEVNQVMSKAIAHCKRIKSVEVQTLNYRTVPVYEQQHQIGWRVSQSLQLKSRDSHALSKLLGELQESLMLQGMGYQVSPEKRNKVQDTLISKAIKEFQHRAKIIAHQLGRKRYRLVNLQINISGSSGGIQRLQALKAMQAAPAAIEAGTQQLTVTANGMIELELN